MQRGFSSSAADQVQTKPTSSASWLCKRSSSFQLRLLSRQCSLLRLYHDPIGGLAASVCCHSLFMLTFEAKRARKSFYRFFTYSWRPAQHSSRHASNGLV